jgi:prephenate dehydrogenase
MIDFSGANVCIIGLGLMGSSAARRLKGQCKKLIGIDRNGESVQYVLHKHWIDAGYQSFEDMDETADVIIFTTPVQQILKYLDSEIRTIRTPCVLLDFGSTKKEIIKHMSFLPLNFQCFACHPMCGKEFSGPIASDESLYVGRPFLVHRISKEIWAFEVLQTIVRLLGAEMVDLDPTWHDRQLAYISHVPFLASASLALISGQDERIEPEVLWNIAANGFYDMTRIAGSDVSMMEDIMATNGSEISDVLQKLIDQLNTYKKLIDDNDLPALRSSFEYAKLLKERAYQCRKSPSTREQN